MARIVLIEDSPTDRAVFTQWLRRAGHEVLEADNAEDGLQLVRDQVPQLVLMDVVLPGMSGFQDPRDGPGRGDQAHPGDHRQHQGDGNRQGLGRARARPTTSSSRRAKMN
jgi:hypothetical protein